MICVGIDVAKDKHDCFILSSEGEVLADVFTIQNNAEGFDTLLQTIRRCARPEDKIKVGLEATGHYSYNILGFLLDKGLPTYVINPHEYVFGIKDADVVTSNYCFIFHRNCGILYRRKGRCAADV